MDPLSGWMGALLISGTRAAGGMFLFAAALGFLRLLFDEVKPVRVGATIGCLLAGLALTYGGKYLEKNRRL